MSTPKPGILTSEFWLTTLGVLGSLAIASGKATPETVEATKTAAGAVVQSVGVLAAAVQSVAYVFRRLKHKESVAAVAPVGGA